MKSEKNNGILMLVGLVFMLGLPVVIGHFTIHTETTPLLQADASVVK
jgi:hypothetical protein